MNEEREKHTRQRKKRRTKKCRLEARMKGVKRIREKVTLDIREKKNVFRKERVKEEQKDTRYQSEKKERI